MSPPLRAAEHPALFPGQLHSSSHGSAPTPVGDAEGMGICSTQPWELGAKGEPHRQEERWGGRVCRMPSKAEHWERKLRHAKGVHFSLGEHAQKVSQ